MDFREALARVRQRNAQSSRQKDREETEGKGAQPGAHEAERYGGSQMSFRDALARVREKNGTQTVPHTSEDPLTQLALQKIETEQQGTTWADVRELAQSRKQEQDQKRLQLGEELLHPEQRVQQDGMQSVPVGVVHATEPFRQQMQTETVRQQKYGGKSYGQIKELLAGMEAGEEKAWLENFAPSVMTAGDYDTEIADVSMELEGLERQRSQLYNAGGSDFFDKGELQEMDQLQDRIKTLSQKKAQLESSRKYGFLSENADYAEGSAYRPALYGQNSAYRIINGEGRQWGSVHESAKHMTQEEIANYNYIFHTEGEEAAKAYIRYLMPTLNSRKMEYVAANAKAVAEAYPALADFASISGTLLGGVGMLDALGQRIVKDVSGDYYTPIDTNSAAMVPSVMSSTIRGTRAQNLAEKHGTIHFDETEHPILSRLLNGKSWGDVYQLGMSMVDSTATAVLSPVLGPGATLLLGGSSATQTMLDAAANGASDEQALTMGALAGAFEYLFEKYELESLIGNIDDGILKALFKQSLSEGFGEGMTTIANYAADSLIMADKSELSRLTAEYMEKDPRLTEAQARKEALKDMAIQTGWDAVGGMATGGIMGGTGAGVNKVTSKLQQLAMEKVTADQEALRKLAIEKVQAEQQGQITENTAPEDGVKYSIKRTQNMSWEEQISGALSHSKNIARNDTLVLDDIPATLVNDGIESKKLAIPLSVITKAKSGKDASHSIKDENLRDLQRGVRNAPIMINNPARNAIVFVTDIKQDGAPILVAFQRNAQFDGDDVHKATSIHLQMDVASMLKALPADATVYAKNESELDATVGVADSLRSLAANIKFTGNTVTENVAGVNGEISSAEGQILRGSDAVQIAEVESAGGGKLTVKLSDGSTADASELSFSDVGEQELWRVIAQYADNAEAARQLLKEYRAGDLKAYEFARGVEEGFLYGKLNIGQEEMAQRGSYVNLLNPMQKNMAYKYGQFAGEKQTKQRQTEASERNAKRIRKGGVHYGYAGQTLDKSKLTKAQRVGVDFAERLAKKKGMTFYFYRSYVNSQGQRVYKDQKGQTVAADKNGWYDPSDGSIHIDLNCGDMGGTVLFTLAHELTHFIQDWSPEKYRILCGILTEGYLEMGQSVQELVQHKQEQYSAKGEELSYEQAFDEVIASSMESVLNDGRVLELLDDIEVKDQSLYEKVRSFIEDVAALVYETIQAYRDLKPDSPEGRIVQRMQGIHEQLRRVFAEGLHEGGENYRQGGKENTTQEGGARNQFRMTNAEIQAVQNIGRISVNQFTAANIKATERFARQYWKEMGVKSPFFRAWFGDWRANDQTKVQVANQKGDSRGVQRNADTGWDIQVSGKVFNETKSHNMSFNKAAVAYLPYINDIISKAILLDSSGVDVGRAKSNNSLLMHSLYAVADIGNGLEIIKLYVEEMNDPNTENTSKRAYQLQNIEKYHYATKGSQNTASPRSVAGGTVHTVADLFAAVKQKDSSLQPKDDSKVVNDDGTPRIVYHGSSEVFHTFSYGHIGSASGVSFLGEGFYFTDKKDLGKRYGENVYACYLQMKKPYYATEADAYKLNVKKLESQGYDGVILKAGAGTVYMVFQNTQIKSATDNVGTFDGKNPDIRYSVRYQKNAAARESLEKENASMGEDVAGLNELVAAMRRQGKRGNLQKSTLDVSASVLMEKAGARGKKTELMELLDTFYRYIGSSEDLNWDGIRQAARPVVNWLMDHVARGKQISNYAKEVLSELRTSRIYLDEAQKGEVTYQFGSYNAFRNMLMGSVIIANEGSMSLDSRWHELSQLYPDVFKEDVTASDMPGELVDIINRLRNSDTSELEFEYNREFMEQELLYRIYGSYWNASTLYIVAGQHEAQIRQLKGKHNQRMNEVYQRHRDMEERQRQTHRQRQEAARHHYEEQYQKREAEYRESRRKAVERHDKSEMKHKVLNVVKELNSLLVNGGKERHIPEQLQLAVTGALEAINMETVDRQARMDKLNAAIESETDPDIREALLERKKQLEGADNRFMEQTRRLQDAYRTLRDSTDPMEGNGYDEVIMNRVEEVVAEVGNTPLRDMTIQQLEQVYEMYTMILTMVRNVNKAFTAQRDATISGMGKSVIRELRSVGKETVKSIKALEGLKAFAWSDLKPVYAFKMIGSKTLSDLFRSVRKGEDIWVVDIAHAREFFHEQAYKYGYDGWDMKKQYRFYSNTGQSFNLSLEQIMSLYAYSKRAQADEHLDRGGFVFDSAIEVEEKKKGVPVKYKVNTANAFNLSKERLQGVCESLTAEQKAFVDAMQDYLSTTMAAKGNEISMQMYGIKLFKEKKYFPLKSAGQYMFSQNQAAGEVRLKNSGFSKKTVPKAGNPIILSNFMDVWTNHVDEMSMYHAFVLPLEDFNRVFNFKTPALTDTDIQGVKAQLQNIYGEHPGSYISQLITQLNGGVRSDPTEGFFHKRLADFKKAAVFMSLSVAVQQPSAVSRAAAYLDSKYFIGRNIKGDEQMKLAEEMKKYAPVALIKEMGYFDTDVGRSTKDYIMGKEYRGFKEKIKGAATDKKYREELMGALPAKMDELTWTAIWQATKREVRDKHPELRQGSEAFLKAAGERFTEIVIHTQVYDSVLAKSAMMRSRSFGMKMVTSFMAEPTTSINMIADALVQGKRGDWRYCRKAIGSVIASQILNSMLVAVVYAMRDDDDDETYGEKYLEALAGKLVESFNPLSYIPFFKDIISICSGYTVERSDMSVVADIYKAWQKLDDPDVSAWKKVEDFGGSICNLFGLPLGNIMRDVRGLWITVTGIGSGPQSTWSGAVNALLEGVTGRDRSKQYRLYSGVIRGDQAEIQRIRAEFDSDAKANSALVSEVKTQYLEGKLTKDKAIGILIEHAGKGKNPEKDQDPAQDYITKWDFQKVYPDTGLSGGQQIKYVEIAEPAGISLEVYIRYCEKAALCESDKDKDGNSVPGSEKEKILKVIDSLPITAKQKDALYMENESWAESGLKDAPWH